jgi:hypothetical protein
MGAISSSEVVGIISGAVAGHGRVDEPFTVLQRKFWGVTLCARRGGIPLIVKLSKPDVFADSSAMESLVWKCAPELVPRPIAAGKAGDIGWRIYEYVEGASVADAAREIVPKMAESLAKVQSLTAGKLSQDGSVPFRPARDSARFIPRAAPAELSGRANRLLEKASALAEELDSWPITIDHTDLNHSNGILTNAGDVVIVDWEESVASCPFFSIHRLLEDAVRRGVSRATAERYIESIPWGTTNDRRRALRISRALAPMKFLAGANRLLHAAGRPPLSKRWSYQLVDTCLTRLEHIRSA